MFPLPCFLPSGSGLARSRDGLKPEQPAERAPYGRLAIVLSRRVAPGPIVCDLHVVNDILAAAFVVVGELRVQAADDVEPVEDIHPICRDLLPRKTVVAGPFGLQLVLDLVDAEGAAQRDERIDLGTVSDPLEAVVRDHGAHRMADDNVGATGFRRLEPGDESAADLVLDQV